jgi:hypothetical protein
MRTKDQRRSYEAKELKRRMTLCKSAHGYTDDNDDYIKRKTDIPHSYGSNYFNAYETKSMNNKKERLCSKLELKRLEV